MNDTNDRVTPTEHEVAVASRLLRWAEEAAERGVETWRPRDAVNGIRRSLGHNRSTASVTGALALLEANGWVTFLEGSPADIGRTRPPVRCQLTPGTQPRVLGRAVPVETDVDARQDAQWTRRTVLDAQHRPDTQLDTAVDAQ